jgi:hypothetical protein
MANYIVKKTKKKMHAAGLEPANPEDCDLNAARLTTSLRMLRQNQEGQKEKVMRNFPLCSSFEA